MKIKVALCLTSCLALALTGCDKAEKANMQSQISELQTNNFVLQGRISELSSNNLILQGRILEVQDKVKSVDVQNSALRQQLELANTKIDELGKDKQRLHAENEKLEAAANAQRAKQDQLSVTKTIDKILARLDRLRSEQAAYSFKTDNERKREEERLKQLANTEQAQIKEMIADLRSMEFSGASTIEFEVGRFVHAYGYYVGYLRMWSEAFRRQGFEETERTSGEQWRNFKKEMDGHFDRIKALKPN